MEAQIAVAPRMRACQPAAPACLAGICACPPQQQPRINVLPVRGPLPPPACSGWGYVLSRDLAEFITNTALMYAALPEK